MQKKLRYQLTGEKLIGEKLFGPWLVNQHFPRYGICRGKQQIVVSLISDYFRQKVKKKISKKI